MLPRINPDLESVGSRDMAEVILQKFNFAVKHTPYEGTFDTDYLVELLGEYFGKTMLNALIKSDTGQGIIMGYLIGRIELECDKEEEEAEDVE